jgi:hypothetical protein
MPARRPKIFSRNLSNAAKSSNLLSVDCVSFRNTCFILIHTKCNRRVGIHCMRLDPNSPFLSRKLRSCLDREPASLFHSRLLSHGSLGVSVVRCLCLFCSRPRCLCSSLSRPRLSMLHSWHGASFHSVTLLGKGRAKWSLQPETSCRRRPGGESLSRFAKLKLI